MDPYEALANEIVLAAVKDYRESRKSLKLNPDSIMARAKVDEVERFFRSDWYKLLTTIDGEDLLRRLEVEE